MTQSGSGPSRAKDAGLQIGLHALCFEDCKCPLLAAWQHIRIARFGGPEGLELAEQPTILPGPGEVRIKVLAAGTGFTDTFIRRGRYPDFKGPLPFTPGYDLVGVVEETGPARLPRSPDSWFADLCVGSRVAARSYRRVRRHRYGVWTSRGTARGRRSITMGWMARSRSKANSVTMSASCLPQ